jgi:hypothetical protein
MHLKIIKSYFNKSNHSIHERKSGEGFHDYLGADLINNYCCTIAVID